LRGADLSFASFKKRNLEDANSENGVSVQSPDGSGGYEAAHLQDAYLGEARMRRADLRSAQLTDAILVDADLQDADLTFGQLDGAILSNAKPRQCRVVWDNRCTARIWNSHEISHKRRSTTPLLTAQPYFLSA